MAQARTADLPELVGVKQACEIFGITRSTLLRWREQGYFTIAPVKIDEGREVWTRDDIEAFQAAREPRRTGPAPAVRS